LKILLVNVLAEKKSTGRIVKDLYFGYKEHGYSCKIAYGRDSVSIIPKEDSYKISNPIDMYAHALETFAFDNHGLASRLSTNKFIKWLNKENFDIIHLHNIHGYYLNYKILFDYINEEFDGKIIWTMHDMWAISGHAAYLDETQLNKEHISNAKSYLKQYPVSFVDKYSRNYKLKKKLFTKKKMTIVTPSNWLTNIMKKSFLKDNEIVTIYNGTDLSQFYPRIVKKDEKKIILAVASIWEDRKGLTDINKLALILPEQYKIIAVGKVPKGKSFNSKIQHIEQTDNIDELANLYSSAYVFINPTHFDNAPMVNIESQSCGTPVITYNTGGASEMIINGETGLVVKCNSVKELLEKIEKINITSEMIENCVKQTTFFSSQRMVEDYVQLITKLKQKNI